MNEVIYHINGVTFRLAADENGFVLWNDTDELPLLDAALISSDRRFFVSRGLDHSAIRMTGTRRHDGIEFEIITKGNDNA